MDDWRAIGGWLGSVYEDGIWGSVGRRPRNQMVDFGALAEKGLRFR